jgi:hypothetical protein
MDLQNIFVPTNTVMQTNIIENILENLILENRPRNENTENDEDYGDLDDINIDNISDNNENNETENPADKPEVTKKEKPKDIIFTYKEYCNKKWEKYKLPEIKQIVKKLKLRVTGRKNVLITRINNHFSNYERAIKIQKVYRGYIVRLSYFLRGPAYNQRHICVNETDGFSLEPLDEIADELFFSFKDKAGLVYGFDIQSLISAYNDKPKILNPYTREEISREIIRDMLSLGNIVKIMYPELGVVKIVQKIDPKNRIYERRRRELNAIGNRHHNTTTPINIELIDKLTRIRQNTYSRRVEELFMEIDLLGNYTQSSWFNNLEDGDCYRFLRILYDLWVYRSGITTEVRKRICQLLDPFSGITLSNENIKEKCIHVMENFVYTGIDDEYRKIGVYYVLSALTVVSLGARMNLYWLYETMM